MLPLMQAARDWEIKNNLKRSLQLFWLCAVKAVRSTHSLEVPVTRDGECLVLSEVCMYSLSELIASE